MNINIWFDAESAPNVWHYSVDCSSFPSFEGACDSLRNAWVAIDRHICTTIYPVVQDNHPRFQGRLN